MKNYIVSLSKRALLLSGALAIFTACDDGDLGDIYKGNSSGEYVSDVNWTDAADKSTGTYIKYFYENASGRDTFCGSIYWEKPNTPETGEPARRKSAVNAWKSPFPRSPFREQSCRWSWTLMTRGA